MQWVRILVLSLIAGLSVAPYATATPVTWEASGIVTSLSNPLPIFTDLSGISVGTPWTLDITFDPSSPGQPAPCAPPALADRFYYGAISNAILQLGGFTYANTGGTITTNYFGELGICDPVSGPTGLVQFWFGGPFGGLWTGGAGGPHLNNGLFEVSYFDANAVNGSLPSTPSGSGGLIFWFDALPGNTFESFPIDLRPVPEPASLLLLGTGLLGAIETVRRRHKQRS